MSTLTSAIEQLLFAARTGDAAGVRALIESDPGLALACDEDGETALAAAAAHGESEICGILTAAGAEVDIHVASSLGLADEIQNMLGHDPELVRARDGFRRATPLYFAAEQNRKAAAAVLLDFGADPNAEAASGDTPVHAAAAAPAFRAMEVLLDRGGAVNARNHRRQTPLHRAVEERWGEATEVIGLLLAAGADVNARDANRETALSRALDRNKTHIVEVLRKAGARE